MTLKEIRERHQLRPFQPFELIVADGHRVPVNHPELLAIIPPGRVVIVALKDGSTERIDLLMVTAIRERNGDARSSRRAK